MNTRGKILLFSGITLTVGTAFYFFYWRTRNAVTATDIPTLQQYRAVSGSSASTLQTTTPAAAATGNTSTAPVGAAGVFSGIVPILTPTTV